MKGEYILIVSLILAILTIGAVSASEDIALENVTASDEGVSIDETPLEEVQTDEPVGDGGDFDFNPQLEDEADLDDMDDDVITINCPDAGRFSVTVSNGTGSYVKSHTVDDDDRYYEEITLSLEDLDIKKAGTYTLSGIFTFDDNTDVTVFSNHVLTVTDSTITINFEDNFYIDGEYFVTVEIPTSSDYRRINVLVDGELDDGVDKDNLGPSEIIKDGKYVYHIALNELDTTFVVGQNYYFEVNVFIEDDEADESSNVDRTILGHTDERQDVSKQVYIPEEISFDQLYDDDVSCYIYDTDATGRVVIYVNGREEYNQTVEPRYYDEWGDPQGGNIVGLEQLNLKGGENLINVTYSGDEKYKPFNVVQTLDYYFIDVDVDEEITDYIFPIEIAGDATGTVEIFFNDTSFINITAPELRENSVSLKRLPFGYYTYKVTYRGDEKYQLDEPIEGEFILSYKFYVTYDESTVYYPDSFVLFTIHYPDETKAVINITYNGKTISKDVVIYSDEDGYFMGVSLTDFAVGENEIEFTYIAANQEYPIKTFTLTLDVDPIIRVNGQIRYNNEDDAIFVCMPGIKGNLNIYMGEYDSDEHEYVWTLIEAVPFADGKATYMPYDWEFGKENAIKLNCTDDDYSEYFDEDTVYCVTIVPDVVVEKSMCSLDDNSMTVILPDDVGETLHVLALDSTDVSTELYNQVANGTVNITLDLNNEEYTIVVFYGEYTGRFDVKVRDISPYFELDVTFPSEINSLDRYVIIKNVPDDADGYLELYIDGQFVTSYMDTMYEVYYYEYEYGNHTWEIKFKYDSFYRDTSKNGTFYIDWVNLPRKIYLFEEISVSLDEDSQGYVEWIVDGELFDVKFLEKGHTYFDIDELLYGTHTFEINYYENNVKKLTKSGSVDVAIHIDPLIYNPYPLTQDFVLYMDVYKEGTDLIVDVDGKKYYVTSYDGCAEVVLSDLVVGDNNVTISVAGEDTNISQVKSVIRIGGYAIDVKYKQKSLQNISILLPEDADGNLTIYNAVYDDDYCSWTEESLFKTVKLIGGKAIITAEEIGWGRFDFIVKYESPTDDYDVNNCLIHPSVSPIVNMNYESIVGENVEVSIDMPDDATGMVEIYLYDDETEEWVLIKTVDATTNFKTNISSFKFGENDIKFEYVGDDYPNIFEIYDAYEDVVRNKTLYHEVMPLDYGTSSSSSDGPVVILELPEGLSGKITVKINDGVGKTTLIDHAPFTSANKTVAITGLRNGEYDLEVAYDDDAYGTFSFEGFIVIPKPDASADVVIPETASEDGFDITLPKDATGGILVTIDGKTTYMPLVNGTAKVDLSELADGNHTISIKYSGDGNYSGFVKSANVTVKKEVPPAPEVPAKIVAKDLAAYYNKVSYSVTVYGTDGKLASGVLVTFKVDGKKVGTAKTNAKGVATIKLSQLPKTYKITSEAFGKSVTKKLTVKQVLTLKKVNVKRSAKKLVLTATLKEGKKAIKGKKITFKFKNKKYTVKTNKKGIAKVTVKKSVLKKLKKGKKVTYQATYLKDTVKRTVKVKK